MTRLPDPDADSLALSRRLGERIAQRIADSGGWIPFDQYMNAALYEPALGYYANGRPVFGPEGDFVTAPGLSPLFGATLGRQVASWLSGPALSAARQPMVLEFGAGTGALAVQLLQGLAEAGLGQVDYCILEPSAALRALQARSLEALPASLARQVRWLDRLPAAFEGVVVANEVLDAMPVQVVEWDGTHWHEMGVALHNGPSGAPAIGWAARPAGAALLAELRTAGLQSAELPVPYRTEVAPQVSAWVTTVGTALRRGAMLLIDYGFPAREYHHPQRAGGTLMAHYRHRAHTDPFILPGLQDLTAHVDFSRVAAAGRAVGLDLMGYTSQARFLINAGIVDAMAATGAAPSRSSLSPVDSPSGLQDRAWFSQASALQRLLSEAEMGELFKVIALGRGMDDGAMEPGFVTGDRSASL